MSLALPFALLALGGGFVWAATRKPKPSATGAPLALPPGPTPYSSPTVDASIPASPPVLDQAQQILTQYALDANMPPNLAAQVARVLSAEGDPNKLDDWASKLDQLNFPKAAQALRAKASALRAVAGASTALGQIHDVLQSPGPMMPTQPSAPPVPMPSPGPIPPFAQAPAAATPATAPVPELVPRPRGRAWCARRTSTSGGRRWEDDHERSRRSLVRCPPAGAGELSSKRPVAHRRRASPRAGRANHPHCARER